MAEIGPYSESFRPRFPFPTPFFVQRSMPSTSRLLARAIQLVSVVPLFSIAILPLLSVQQLPSIHRKDPGPSMTLLVMAEDQETL